MDLLHTLKTLFSVLFGRPTFKIKIAEEAADYIQAYIQEIANQHHEMRQMVDLMTSTLNGTDCLVWRKDAEGRYLFANRAMIKTVLVPYLDDFESATQKILGKTDAEILAEAASGNMVQNTLLETMPVSDRYTLQSRQSSEFLEQGSVNGTPMLIRMVRNPIFSHDGVLDGIVGYGLVLGSDRQLGQVRMLTRTGVMANEPMSKFVNPFVIHKTQNSTYCSLGLG